MEKHPGLLEEDGTLKFSVGVGTESSGQLKVE